MIPLTDIAYVRSGVADLEAATRFATGIVGLELVTPTEVGVAHLRADRRHHCLALVEGPSGVISSGFTVADADALDAAETELERSGISVHRGSAAIFLYFLGPEGFTYEYSVGVRRIEDDAAWVPRTFDPAEPGSIDMWLGPTARPITQPQLRSLSRRRSAAACPAPGGR